MLLRKHRSYAEIYNDLDSDLINLFSVLRSDRAPELIQALELTPFARAEFEEAYEISDDPVEEARRLIIRSFMGFGSDGFNRNVTTGFRANSNRSGTTPARDWMNYPDCLRAIVQRLRGVVIENADAVKVMNTHDAPDTLHYLDPPYVPATRSQKYRKGKRYHVYTHDMEEPDHVVLLQAIKSLKGSVIISGYPAPMYDEFLAGWRRIIRSTHADGARKRIEVLWLNPRCVDLVAGSLPFGLGS